MNRTVNEWARVKVAAVFSGSEAQARNVLQMALDDIAELGAKYTSGRITRENTLSRIGSTFPKSEAS